MKKQILIIISILFLGTKLNAQVGINSTNTPPDSKAMLDVSSGTKGMLIPRMTAAQKAAIAYPVPIGLMVYDQTINQFSYYNGSAWIDVSGANGSTWTVSGNDIYNANLGNIGIGTTTPTAKLQVTSTVNGDVAFRGENTGTSGYGVYGRASNGGFGVFGEALGTNAVGGYFTAFGTNKTGLKAEVSSGGTAAYFTATGTGGKGLIVDQGSVGIGTTTPNPSAKLEVNSTNQGFLLPRMTTAQRIAIASPSTGLMVFVTDTQSIWIFRDGAWLEYTENYWKINGANSTEIKNTNTGGFWSANPVGLDYSATNITNPPTAPTSGAGTRMMWIPSRSAFRVGTVSNDYGNFNTYWDANNIGLFSFASGIDTRASGKASTAMGYTSIASGDNSTAIGRGPTASGSNSTAFGYFTAASGNSTTAMGTFSIAYGNSATAMGIYAIANGEASLSAGSFTQSQGQYSTAMGEWTTAQGKLTYALGYNSKAQGDYSKVWGTGAIATHEGAMILTDASLKNDPVQTYQYPSEAINQFKAVFVGGYKLYTSGTVGVQLSAGGNAWATISDSTKKQNLLPINGEDFLQKIFKLKLTSWNYKGQDAKVFRHYGPMAQDFFAAFGNDKLGTIGCDTLINQADFDGVNLIAIQALEKRTQELSKQNEELKNKLKLYEARFEAIEASLKVNSGVQTGK